ncbi:MAG: D-alanyl-D-alanine carboxypeptidase/D-alanyl-D-alanine-endopeptidase [Boseongicola sp.]|nr:D-alanyl-D-alanine carboxypeptidase/D-alanyl-D-alanine-endopeptidase [Boseongicola sp.]
MTTQLTRRSVLVAATAAGLGQAAFARAPLSTERPQPRGVPPVAAPVQSGFEHLVERSNLSGVVAYALIDLESGKTLDARQPGRKLPPASTLKAITSIYASQRLGDDYQFKTRLYSTAKIEDGVLLGDIALVGDGDPTLDTDTLGDLARALREVGVHSVSGRFLVWSGDFPSGKMIDEGQPDHVAYNPAFCGLNLNYNRVHFEWKPRGDAFDITMQARGLRFSPGTNVSRMAVIERSAPIFEYREGAGVDRWSVARKALGRKDGARWLPVRFPELYAADVFRTLARSNGILLGDPVVVRARPNGRVLAEVTSKPLNEILKGMMRYSTNLTAEMTGLTASMAYGVPVKDLIGSGSRMAGWAETNFGARGMQLRDHSGLGYASEMSAENMAQILAANTDVSDLMRPFRFPDPKGNAKDQMSGVSVAAKTGTLNFVSTLAGFLEGRSGRRAAFAIFTADKSKRDAIPVEQRERPKGSKSWSRRSRSLQKALLGHWADNLERL